MGEPCTSKTHMGLTSLVRDFRGQISWGRVCSVVALAVAVVGEFRGMDTAHLAIWLSAALGNYGASKITEMVCHRTGNDRD